MVIKGINDNITMMRIITITLIMIPSLVVVVIVIKKNRSNKDNSNHNDNTNNNNLENRNSENNNEVNKIINHIYLLLSLFILCRSSLNTPMTILHSPVSVIFHSIEDLMK